MRDIFVRPAIIEEAALQSKGKNIVIEILIFLLLFLCISVAQVIILIPFMIILLFTNKGFLEHFKDIAGMGMSDYGSVNEYTERLLEALPDNMMLFMLFATVATIGGVIVYCVAIEKRRLRTLGFVKRHAVSEYLKGYLIGAALIASITAICLFAGTLEFHGFSENIAIGTIVLYFFGYMIQGMSEEMLCRGYLMVSVSRRCSLPVAIITNSLLFAFLHIVNPGISVIAMVNLTLFGVFVSVYMIKRGSIWGAGAAHSAWNFVLGNVFGTAVSGNETTTSIFKVTLSDSGLSGFAFGLEEGIATTIIMVAAIALVSLTGKNNSQRISL